MKNIFFLSFLSLVLLFNFSVARAQEVEITDFTSYCQKSSLSDATTSTTTEKCYRPFDVYKIYITDFVFFAVILILVLWGVNYIFRI